MHQAVLADVEITGPGAASPLVGTSERDVVLEGVHARKAALLQLLHLVVDAPFLISQRLHLAVPS